MKNAFYKNIAFFFESTHSSFCRSGAFVERYLILFNVLNVDDLVIAGDALMSLFNAFSPHLVMLCGLANVYAAKTNVFRNIINFLLVINLYNEEVGNFFQLQKKYTIERH